ncbi:LamB/YcsF family protein [Streptomyces violens]|uniref:LamB/YcsF family protein n=1 Tax=Streptomyces violens TaxID=66377 RepID=UPI0004C0F7D0|nr:5-oxoprolinase subunit PxpA [Streptomyces violens]
MTVIDLNSDLGEGFGQWTLGDDDALLSIVSSANVACGYHAGDPTVMRRVCELAAERGVAIGAQVGYRDLPGFGRRFIDVDPRELVNDVVYQIAALDGFARLAGTKVAYVKPHGALYNAIVHHEAQAEAVADAVSRYDVSLPVLGLPGSAWLRKAAEAGLTPVHEAFADRAYTPEGTLVSRREPGAVLHDPDVIVARCLRMVIEGVVEAIDGTEVPLTVRSLCVHGDTQGAVEIARRLRKEFDAAGLSPTPFATPSAAVATGAAGQR